LRFQRVLQPALSHSDPWPTFPAPRRSFVGTAPGHARCRVRQVTGPGPKRTLDEGQVISTWPEVTIPSQGVVTSGRESTPASRRCAIVIWAGAPVSGSKPPPDFGKAITSRMDSDRD